VKCDYCGKGRPRLWTKDGKFCDSVCRDKAREEKKGEKYKYHKVEKVSQVIA